MRFTWRAGVTFLIFGVLAIVHLDAGVPGNDQPDSKEKPLLMVAVVSGSLEPSCEPGRPVAFLKVRVTNRSRVSTPALPASDGIEAHDSSSPLWQGTAALPALRPGQVIEVAVPLEPPANLLPGKHEFQVTVNPRHLIEQEHYKFNSAGPGVVDIPKDLCAPAHLRTAIEKPPAVANERTPQGPPPAENLPGGNVPQRKSDETLPPSPPPGQPTYIKPAIPEQTNQTPHLPLKAVISEPEITPVANVVDDYENKTPTQWWVFSSQTFSQVSSNLNQLSARIVDIKYDNFSPFPFTTVLGPNTGACKKGDKPLWYYGISPETLKQMTADGRVFPTS